MPHARRLLGVSCFCLVSGATLTLHADEGDSAIAVELFNAGRALADAGDYAKACPKFADSAKRAPHVGTLARLAECEEKLGHMVGARLHWGEAKALAERLNDSRFDHALREYARIDALVPKLRLSLLGAPPADIAVTVDSETIDQAALDVPIPVEAGPHTVRATASGKKPFLATVITKSDGAVTPVPLTFEDTSSAVPGAPPDATPPPLNSTIPGEPPVSQARWSTQKTLAVVAGGLGVVGVGVGSYFGLRAFSKWSDAKSECGAGCGPGDAAHATQSDARTAATVSTVTFVAGGAALAGAALLWFTAPKATSRSQSAALRAVSMLAPMLGPSVAGLVVSGNVGR